PSPDLLRKSTSPRWGEGNRMRGRTDSIKIHNCSSPRFLVQDSWPNRSGPQPLRITIMSRVVRSAVKRLAQKVLGQSDVRGFVRKRKLWLSKRIYRRPVA